MTNIWRVARFFWASIILSIVGIIAAGIFGGPSLALVVAILALLEVSLSFENAVVNATVLARMSAFWQKMFLTVGILIAVVGMRLFFPLAIVAATASLGMGEVLDLALHHPLEYAEKLHHAHPLIAAFGGIFLLMVFLDFILDKGKRVHWIESIERPLAKAGQLKLVPVILAIIALGAVSAWVAPEPKPVLTGGLFGLGAYLGVRFLSLIFEKIGGIDPEYVHPHAPATPVTGLAAFGLFAYLEVLDASFSFDGVVGAFAITSNVFAIMLGLGIGALVVRELTVWLVRHDTLKELIYLEHGAYYAVGALAVMLGISLRVEVPEAVTGLIGAAIIAASLVSSLRAKT